MQLKNPYNANDFVKRVNQTSVYEVVKQTALVKANELSSRLDNAVFLKREDQQRQHSFKLRGAYQKISQLSDWQKKTGRDHNVCR